MPSPIYLTADEAREAFRGWVELALTGLVSEVILAAPTVADARRPALPYATVMRTRGRNLSTPHRRVGAEVAPADPEGATNELDLTRMREAVVEVQAFGDQGPDLLELLPTTRDRLAERDYLHTAGIAIRELSDMLDLRDLRDTVHEASAMQEYAMVYATEDLTRVGTIETLDTMGYSGIPIQE